MKQRKIGEYFCVSLDEIKAIARRHLENPSVKPATCDTFAAYLILCRGAGKDYVTSWTANGICKRTHMTLKRAEQATDWLIKNHFIAEIAINNEAGASSTGPGNQVCTPSPTELEPAREKPKDRHRYEIIRHHSGECIYMPNSIIDGQPGHQNDPALKRLLERCEPDLRAGINLNDARTDALLLLLQFNGVHHLDIDGGVNPNIWQCTWTCSKGKEDFEYFRSASSIGDKTFDVFSAQAGQEVFNPSLLGGMFTYIANETQRNRRLERALKNLRELRFLYQVVQVWGKPCNSNQFYTLQYPLHILDRSRRNQNEPAIGPKIDEFLRNRLPGINGINEECHPMVAPDKGNTDAKHLPTNSEGIFFLTARGLSLFPVTSLRLRYLPNDADTTAGMTEQRRMAEIWQTDLESL